MDGVKLPSDLNMEIENLVEETVEFLAREESLNIHAKIIEWSVFSLSYINLAELGCNYLLSSDKKENKDGSLIAAILYNLKHGLELMVKMSVKVLETEGQGLGTKPIHDLQTLYKNVEKIFLKKYIKRSDYGELKKFINRLFVLTRHYYHMDRINKYLTKDDFKLLDRDNTLFKYPENNVGISINYSSIFDGITKEDIETIKGDAREAKIVIFGIYDLLNKKVKKLIEKDLKKI